MAARTDISTRIEEGLANLRAAARHRGEAGGPGRPRIDAPEHAVGGAPPHDDASARARLCVPMPKELHTKVKLWALVTGGDVAELVRVHLERTVAGLEVSQRQA